MIEIKDLLVRFESILSNEERKTLLIAQAIGSVLGINISKENVKVKNGTVYLNVKPIYKSEVFLKKEKILVKLDELLGIKSPKDLL